VHDDLGWNFRMTNLQAALGVAQLERLDEFVTRKRAIDQHYRQQLEGLDGIVLAPRSTSYAETICWVFGLILADHVPFDAAEAIARLGKAGIGTRPFFWPMHEQPVFRRMGLFEGEQHPVAERIARRGLYLPSGMALTAEQLERSAAALRSVLS
jgi:perosamine synthetase